MAIAENKPNLPISSAIFDNFSYKGVIVSFETNDASIFPTQDFSPVTIVTIFPSPVKTLVPDIKTGLGTSCLSIFSPFSKASYLLYKQLLRVFLCNGSVSPVIADSSTVTSTESINIPSAGTSIPPSIHTISPTKI